MYYCQECGHAHEIYATNVRPLTKVVSLERLRDPDGRYHNQHMALVESLAQLMSDPSVEVEIQSHYV
jgi:hypothetical protein